MHNHTFGDSANKSSPHSSCTHRYGIPNVLTCDSNTLSLHYNTCHCCEDILYNGLFSLCANFPNGLTTWKNLCCAVSSLIVGSQILTHQANYVPLLLVIGVHKIELKEQDS